MLHVGGAAKLVSRSGGVLQRRQSLRLVYYEAYPEIPTLHKQFSAVIEASSRSESLDSDGAEMVSGTWVVDERYDYAGNEAHVVVHNRPDWRGDTLHQLVRLDDDEKWLWKGLRRRAT